MDNLKIGFFWGGGVVILFSPLFFLIFDGLRLCNQFDITHNLARKYCTNMSPNLRVLLDGWILEKMEKRGETIGEEIFFWSVWLGEF